MKAGIRVFALLALSASFSACNDPMAPEEDALAHARAGWAAESPPSYRYDFRNTCYCPLVHVRITVTHGEASGVEVLSDGEWSEPAAPEGHTIEELFARIEAGIEADPHRVEITYDPVLGYPTSVFFDPEANVIDEEWGFVVTHFQSL